MAIDFALQLPCSVRNSIPEAKLLSMVKHQGIAEFAVSKFRETYPHYDLATIANECTVEIAVLGPDGAAKQTPVTVGQLLALVAPLDEVKGHCNGCPGNVSSRSFGCIGKVNYPITGEAEAWLLARLPENPKSPSLALLFKFLADVEIDGTPVDSLRNRAQMFELKAPAVRKWGVWFGKKQVTSSQLLHMLAFGGNIGARQAQLYTKLLSLTSIPSEPPSPSNVVEQFKIFMRAISMAAITKVDLLVDA